MIENDLQVKPRVAVLITGTYREIEFLLELFPYMAGPVAYDIYLVLRHIRTGETSHLGGQEKDFEVLSIVPLLKKNCFLCELPDINPAHAVSKYLIPTGPTNMERECGMLSMFNGITAGISMIKSSIRFYTHAMKIRTDYLPFAAPWISGMLELYEHSGYRVLIDGCATVPWRYPDRPDIRWQGSISEVFSFSSFEQFLKLWDIEDVLPEVWTGVPETTLFRAAIKRFLGDELQSPRRNESFLKKYFEWEPNDTKQSFYLLRAGVFSKDAKQMILNLLESRQVKAELVNKLIRISYDFIKNLADETTFETVVRECFADSDVMEYIKVCHNCMINVGLI